MTNYLDSNHQQDLEQALPLVGTDFIPLDAWWLQYVGYGIMDVPPQIWQYDSLQQCANYTNQTGCEQIVHDSIYLFNNMGRIGVDWHDAGLGQTIGANIDTQALWFLDEAPIDFSSTYWGWVQNPNNPQSSDFACLRNRFTNVMAGVCWVCQDVPTLLYERLGYSLENAMNNSGYAGPGDYNEAFYRNVIAVVDFADWESRNNGGNPLKNGADPTYRIGESVFTSTAQILPSSYFSFNHVGIVVRGADSGMTIEQALDHVLVAQISYSSQGLFLSNANDLTNGALNISPDGYTGRYEIITLRTYLYKHQSSLATPIPLGNPVTDANSYLSHWSPIELSLRYSNE